MRDDALEQAPDRVGDRPVVAIDEQAIAFVVALLRMSGEMDFADRRERIIGQIVDRRKAVIGRRHEDIVDVEQQPAAGAPRDGADKIRLAHCRFVEQDIGRGIFEQEPPADRLLHLVDMIAHRRERRLRVGQRQQVVEIGGLVGRPSQMLGDERRLVALNESAEAREMRLVQGLRTADRHAYAVQRNRMVAANSLEGVMRRAAGAHVVLGVNLEEAARLRPPPGSLAGARA